MLGFDKGSRNRSGYTTTECVVHLQTQLKQLKKRATGPLVLCAHDMGTYWAKEILLRDPNLIDMYAAVSCGTCRDIEFIIWKKYVILMLLIHVLISWIPIISTCMSVLIRICTRSEFSTSMCYVYTNLFLDYYVYPFRALHLHNNLKRDPVCPYFFLYGTEDPYAYFDEQWIEQHELNQTGNRIVIMEGAIHYPMKEQKYTSSFNIELHDWIEEYKNFNDRSKILYV